MTAASEIRRAEPAAGRAFQGFTDQRPDCRPLAVGGAEGCCLHRGDRINSAQRAELRTSGITRISRLGSLSAVVSTVSDLVHARAPRSIGMALTHGEQYQGGLRCLFIGRENRAPATRWLRDIKLDATPKSRAVPAFLFASAQPFDEDPHVLKPGNNRLNGRSSRLRTAGQILSEKDLVDPNLEARAFSRAHPTSPRRRLEASRSADRSPRRSLPWSQSAYGSPQLKSPSRANPARK